MTMATTLRISVVTCGLLGFLSSTRCLAGDWRQFRGPGGLGVADVSGLPVTWNSKSGVTWKTALPGPGSSSPIALGDRIYLTCYSGYGTFPERFGKMENLTLHLVCIGRDGVTVWDKEIGPKLPESEEVRDHGYAAATPATDGEHLYVFFGRSGVFKFDLNGQQVWNADVGSMVHRWGCGTSPVLYKNLVIVNASVESGSLVAIDKKSGKEAWRAGGMDSSWNTPHLVPLSNGKTELAISVRNKLLGFDPESGKKLWSCGGIQDYVCPSIVSENGILYAAGARESRVIALRAGGRGDVTETHRLWEARAGANVSSPVIRDGHLYGVSDRNKTAYCLRLSDGKVMFKTRFPGQPYASALLADDKIFILTRYDGTFVLAAEPEYKQLAHNKLDDESTFNASPIAAHDRLYLRSDRYLYCIGEKS